MIVRNEERVIARCLHSVKPFISHWIISDTGSRDRTREIIRETLMDIPGRLSDDEWGDFSHNRNLALNRAKGVADYLLLIDADMIVNVLEDFRDTLGAEAYFIPFTGDFQYSIIRLVKANLPWTYRGVVHEVIECAIPVVAVPLEGVTITHFEDGSARADKFKREIRVLSQELERHPDDPRTVFYLAQSYRDSGNFEKAAELYEKRVGMGGWIQETWYALYQLASMQMRTQPDKRTAIFTYLQAYQLRPTRLEPIFYIAQFYNSHKQFSLAYLFARLCVEMPYPDDILFVERNVYDSLLPFEYAICCHHTGRTEEAKRVTSILEFQNKIPADLLSTLKSLVDSA